jgi:hypothetical protein
LGPTPIVRNDGIVFRTNNHTLVFDDGNGNMSAVWKADVTDNIHENCAGRQLIADEWEQLYLINK